MDNAKLLWPTRFSDLWNERKNVDFEATLLLAWNEAPCNVNGDEPINYDKIESHITAALSVQPNVAKDLEAFSLMKVSLDQANDRCETAWKERKRVQRRLLISQQRVRTAFGLRKQPVPDLVHNLALENFSELRQAQLLCSKADELTNAISKSRCASLTGLISLDSSALHAKLKKLEARALTISGDELTIASATKTLAEMVKKNDEANNAKSEVMKAMCRLLVPILWMGADQ